MTRMYKGLGKIAHRQQQTPQARTEAEGLSRRLMHNGNGITAPPIEKLRMESKVGSPLYGDRRRHFSPTERLIHYGWRPVDSEIPIED